MSLKGVWKTRAEDAATEPKEDLPIPVEFKARSFADIRAQLGDAMKKRVPAFSDAVDDPTSNIGMLLDAVAEADANAWSQIEAIAATLEGKKPK